MNHESSATTRESTKANFPANQPHITFCTCTYLHMSMHTNRHATLKCKERELISGRIGNSLCYTANGFFCRIERVRLGWKFIKSFGLMHHPSCSNHNIPSNLSASSQFKMNSKTKTGQNFQDRFGKTNKKARIK